jgi:hypothetical protein
MPKKDKDVFFNPEKFTMSITDQMHSALKEEQKKRMVGIQEVIRQILSEYFSRLLIPKQVNQ